VRASGWCYLTGAIPFQEPPLAVGSRHVSRPRQSSRCAHWEPAGPPSWLTDVLAELAHQLVRVRLSIENVGSAPGGCDRDVNWCSAGSSGAPQYSGALGSGRVGPSGAAIPVVVGPGAELSEVAPPLSSVLGAHGPVLNPVLRWRSSVEVHWSGLATMPRRSLAAWSTISTHVPGDSAVLSRATWYRWVLSWLCP
jgi:hypothetical protein